MNPQLTETPSQQELRDFWLALAVENSGGHNEHYLIDQCARFELTFRTMLPHVQASTRLLSIGAGGAYVELALRAVTGCSLTVVDLPESVAVHEATYARHGARSIAADVAKDGFEIQDACDVMLFAEVVEHIPAAPATQLQKLRPSLASDGHLFLSTPNASSLRHILQVLMGRPTLHRPEYTFGPVNFANEWVHRREYFPVEIERALRSTGFGVIETSFCWYRTSRPLLARAIEEAIPRLRPCMLFHAIRW